MNTTELQVNSLHQRYGVEVHNVDLRKVTAIAGYPKIRAAFEKHSVLLFRNQSLDDAKHLSFASLFGLIEDRSRGINGPIARMSPVSNIVEGKLITDKNEKHIQHLRANQLWHTDSTFLPVPALANVICARIVSTRDGETELVSTRIAWQDMPAGLKAKARNAILWQRYGHSRAKISKKLANDAMFASWQDQAWRAVWRNPTNGAESLYIASHAFAVEGMSETEGQELIEELTQWATRDEYVYRHHWRKGDVQDWDERATMHRGRAWPYEQERTLASVCVSASYHDGLGTVSPAKPALSGYENCFRHN